MSETNDTPRPERIECPAAKDPAVRSFIFAGMLLAFGAWCFYGHCILGQYQRPDDSDINAWFGYVLNAGGAIVFPLVGLVPLFLGLRFLRRKLVADAEKICVPGSPAVAWKDITRLDATDLPEKGVLRLEYGTAEPLTLDKWKIQNFKSLVAFVESHVPPEAMESGKTPKATRNTND